MMYLEKHWEHSKLYVLASSSDTIMGVVHSDFRNDKYENICFSKMREYRQISNLIQWPLTTRLYLLS